jgi:hypothetical protein
MRCCQVKSADAKVRVGLKKPKPRDFLSKPIATNEKQGVFE